MATLVADCETDGLLPDMTRLWCLAIGDPHTGKTDLYADQPGYRPISEGVNRLSATERVVFHNGLGFDLFAINQVYPGALRVEQVWDSMVVSRLLDPREKYHNLEAWGRRLGIPKQEHTDWTRWSPEMGERCVQDVNVTISLFRKLWKAHKGWEEAVSLEFKVQFVLTLQHLNGFAIDLHTARVLEAELRQEVTVIERELQEVYPPIWVPKKVKGSAVVTPKQDNERWGYTKGAPFSRIVLEPFNPGSRMQIEERLRREYGWKPRKFTPTGRAKIDETTLNDLAIIYPNAKPMARYFRVDKQLGQLADGDNAWLKLEKDGRVYGSVNTLGAITRRMTHFNPNMGQADKKDKRMRAVWVPRPGWKLVGADAEGLELRMLAHYLTPYDGGEYTQAVISGTKEEGTDVHSRTQTLLGLYDRDTGAKRIKYALLYGAGNTKLGLIIFDDADLAGKPRPKGSPAKIGRDARNALEKGFTGLDRLVEKTKRAHRERGWVRAFDGGRIYTRSQHASLNTLLQGAGAVVMKKALAIFHFEEAVKAGYVSTNFMTPKGFAYCANVHDEVQLEADPKISTELGQMFARSITLAGEAFNLRCPLSGSFAVGDNWKETH